MTWIVGMPTMFGYSMGISDIRVTHGKGECDCLQKIYPIARSIALGFAGSVSLGFKMVTDMKGWLHNDQPNCAWKPLDVVELWPERARKIFADSSAGLRERGCSLMMLSADPDKSSGMGPECYVHIFKAPDFAPTRVPTNKVAAIGIGTGIQEFERELNEISTDHERNFSIMRMEAGMPGGMGNMLGFHLTEILKRTKPFGISSHLHYCWVYLGKTIIKTNNHMTTGPWTAMEGGSGILAETSQQPSKTSPSFEPRNAVSFEMPKIAQSFEELAQLLAASRSESEALSA